jgi:1-acyl-sn-glycerol-3-phosphate acyltransferase
MQSDSIASTNVPPVPGWLQSGFHGFLTPFFKRHFHAIAIDRQTRCDQADLGDAAVIVYANHPSWWDPLIAHFLNRRLFPSRQFYAPIDALALQQYRVFSKLGFYGVQLQSTRGAAAFLKQSTAILSRGDTVIWMTPEGRFCDVRDHSAELMPGLAHLCRRMEDGFVIPLALEYVFWEERLPVCLAKTGSPIRVSERPGWDKPQWSTLLAERLRQTQTSLSRLAVERDSQPFDNLLRGGAGAGMVYDSFRRIKALLTGQRFRSQHGEHFE